MRHAGASAARPTAAEAGPERYARARGEVAAQAGPGAAHPDLLLVRHERTARARQCTSGQLGRVGARYAAVTGTAAADPPTPHEGGCLEKSAVKLNLAVPSCGANWSRSCVAWFTDLPETMGPTWAPSGLCSQS